MTDAKAEAAAWAKRAPTLFALHGHWMTADAVRHHLRRSNRRWFARGEGLKPRFLSKTAFDFSTFHVIRVWYALLYVVIEGYGKLEATDAKIDELLAEEQMVDSLRRFRNATFHYQKDPIPPKLLEFLTAKDSEIWIRDLNKAFDKWLTKELRIYENLTKLRERVKKSDSDKRQLKKDLRRARFGGKHQKP